MSALGNEGGSAYQFTGACKRFRLRAPIIFVSERKEHEERIRKKL